MCKDLQWSRSPSKLESEGGVHPSIRTLGRFMDTIEVEWQAKVGADPDAAWSIYSAGMELKSNYSKLYHQK